MASGNYLALKATPSIEGATVKTKIAPGNKPYQELDSDLNVVYRIADKNTQKIYFTVDKDGKHNEYVFSLNNLVLESAE